MGSSQRGRGEKFPLSYFSTNGKSDTQNVKENHIALVDGGDRELRTLLSLVEGTFVTIRVSLGMISETLVVSFPDFQELRISTIKLVVRTLYRKSLGT